MNININKNAPVKSANTIQINAPIDTVWHVLTDINKWPSWQKSVSESILNANLNEGSSFKWKANGISFRSVIHTIKPKTLFGWTGKTFGASAIHNWEFIQNDNVTIVHVEESLQGVLPRLFKNYFQKSLDKGMQTSLEELKTASENYNNKL